MHAPERLEYTITVKPVAGTHTRVTWHLDEAAGGTRLRLEHRGVAQAAGSAAMTMTLLTALDKGWDEHFAALRQSVGG